jgi:hypothetical protein
MDTQGPSPKGFQSPKFSNSDFREVCGCGLGLGRPKSSAVGLYENSTKVLVSFLFPSSNIGFGTL